MNSTLNSKNRTMLLLIVFIMVLLFALYYYIVLPKQDAAASMNNEVSSLQTEITSLEQRLVAMQESAKAPVNEFALRKKVPATREIDAILLNIEEIQYVTGSRVENIEFNNYDALVSGSSLQDPNATQVTEEQTTETTTTTNTNETEQTTTETTTTESTEQPVELPVSTIGVESLPPSLKLITFNISVISPNHVNMQNFIKEIEKIERVMNIETIDFSLPGEENEFAEDGSDVVTADVQVTTFYFE